MSTEKLGKAICMALLGLFPVATAVAAGPTVLINEIRTDQPSVDVDEYFELVGLAGTDLTGLTYIVIGDGAGGSGTVEAVVPLAGSSIPLSGFFVAGEATLTLAIPDLITTLAFENSDNVTHMLVSGFLGASGDDLDINDDGVLDTTPWTTILDSISLVGVGVPGVDGDHIYSATVLGPNGPFVPGQAYRCDPATTWAIGAFDLTDSCAVDSVGVINASCSLICPCGSAQTGDCFVANGTPNCDDATCCQLVIDFHDPTCETEWTQACADLALLNCLSCGDASAGSCFSANGTPFCDISVCCDTVCGMDPTCCEITGWDQACADLAIANCVIETVGAGDVILGLSNSDIDLSLELIRGPVAVGGGVQAIDSWQGSFIQDVTLDNLGGIAKNPAGNLLGVNFGPNAATGGTIFNFATCLTVGDGVLIGDTLGVGGAGLTPSRLVGISVSPDNTKIACVGYDSGQVVVYDYIAGDCTGSGASLSGARETLLGAMCPGDTQGTAWLDDNTVIAFASTGNVISVNATTMAESVVATVLATCGPAVTDIVYEPSISAFVYLLDGTFSGATTNTLWVLDPSDWSTFGSFDFTTSINTLRAGAFDIAGNLYISQFTGAIDIIENAATPASIVANTSLDWYSPLNSATFNGLTVALGGVPCPWDCGPPIDGSVGIVDLLALLANWGGPSDCDFDGSGVIDIVDLLALLANWGPCP